MFHSFSNICQKSQSTLGQLAYFSTTAQKMKFTIKDLVTFTEEILLAMFSGIVKMKHLPELN